MLLENFTVYGSRCTAVLEPDTGYRKPEATAPPHG